ncbi:unnamed protein product [Blepharisma stoltei]|uniref:Uncharacterized protein n=1 Tax=Blepharisma stoltei TaxID=1481888 RepID=A0AAU9K4Z2_9CILI|nr:unnamed protein product [Blepharisma stoltei]
MVVTILSFLSLALSLVCQEKHWFPKPEMVDTSDGNKTLEVKQNTVDFILSTALKDADKTIVQYSSNHNHNEKQKDETSSEETDSAPIKNIENDKGLKEKVNEENEDIRKESKLSEVSDTEDLI